MTGSPAEILGQAIPPLQTTVETQPPTVLLSHGQAPEPAAPVGTDRQALIRDVARQRERLREERFRSAWEQGLKTDPDLLAEGLRIAKEIGQPLENLGQNLDVAREVAQREAANYQEMQKRFPTLLEHLQDVEFVGLVHDDLGNLKSIEGEFDWVHRNWSAGRAMNARGLLGAVAALHGGLQNRPPDDAETLAQLDALIARNARDQGFGGIVVEMAGQMAETTGAALAAGGAAAGVAALGGPISSGAAFTAVSGATIFSATAIIEGGNAFLDLVQKGVSPEAAQRAAFGIGAINGLLEVASFKVAAKPFREAFPKLFSKRLARELSAETAGVAWKTFLRQYGASVIAESTVEGAQEVVSMAVENVATLFDRSDLPQDWNLDRVSQAFFKSMAGMSVLGGIGPSINLAADMARAGRATDQQRSITKLFEAVEASKVQERSPETLEAFASKVKKTVAQNVYIRGSALRETLDAFDAAAPADPQTLSGLESLERILPGITKQLEEAVASGGDVVLPTEQFLGRLGRQELGRALLQHVRLDPNDPSAAELKSITPEQHEQMAQAARDVLDQQDAVDSKWIEEAQAIQDEVRSSLVTATFSGEKARVGAILARDLAVTEARARGVSPAELWKTDGPTILRGVAEQGADSFASTGFVSALARAIPEVGSKSATPTGWKQTLASLINKGTIKEAEIEATGLREWLDLQEGKVSKEQVQAFLDANGIQVDTVQLGGAFNQAQGLLERANNRLRARLEEGGWSAGVANDFTLDLINNPEQPADDILSEYAANNVGVSEIDNLSAALRAARRERDALSSRSETETLGSYAPITRELLLNQNATFATFSHEMAHWWLSARSKTAQSPNATAESVEDLQTLLTWFGVQEIATWNGLSLEQQRKHHEQFALNFEIYLHEGKAPTTALLKVFRKFAAWVTRAYKSIRDELNRIFRQEFGHDLPGLTDEVRAVMDRMLASSEQIARAREIRHMTPLFQTQEEAAAAGVSAADWAEVRNLAAEADEQAREERTQQMLADTEWLSRARGKYLKAKQTEHNRVRAEVQAEIQREVELLPVFRIRRYLRTGVFVDEKGNEIPRSEPAQSRKLRREIVEAMLPGADLTTLRADLAADGAHPDSIATTFGFPGGGKAMVLEMLGTPQKKEVIANRTDERMLEDHVDLTEEGIAAQVEEAVTNEARQRLVASELKAMQQTSQSTRVLLAAAKEAAVQVLGSRPVGEIRVRDLSASATRLRREVQASLSANDIETARLVQRRLLLQQALVMEALEARSEIKSAQKAFDKFKQPDKKLAATRDTALVAAGRAILSQYGIGPSGLQDPMVHLQQVADYLPEVFAELSPLIVEAQAKAKPWQQMSLDDFRDLRELIVTLWEQSKSVRQAELDGKKAEIEAVATEAADALRAIGLPKEVRGTRGDFTALERAQRSMMDAVANARRVEHLFETLDGGKDGVWTSLFRRVSEAADASRVAKREILQELEALTKAHDFGQPFKILAPELGGYEFGRGNGGHGKKELLGTLQHMGNDSNLYKLLVGRVRQGWAPSFDPETREVGSVEHFFRFVDRMIVDGVLSKADFDYLQSRWDINERLLKPIQETHRKLYGYTIRTVEARPVVNRLGTWRGGYVPAKTHRLLVNQAKINDLDAKAEIYQSAPTVPRGFTIERVEKYARELSLELADQIPHISEVLDFIHLQPAVRDVQRVLNSRKLAPVLEQFNPSLLPVALLPWLKRAAFQTVSTPSEGLLDTVVTHLSRGANSAIMFGNLSNALVNLTGLITASTKVPLRRIAPEFLRSLASFIWAPRKTAQAVAALSPTMKVRLHKQVFELQRNLRRQTSNPGTLRKLMDFSEGHTYILQQITQNIVDITVWRAAYNHSMAGSKGMNDAKAHQAAVRQADAAVRKTQMAGNPEDISSWEFGGALKLAMFPFQGWFINWGNLNVTQFQTHPGLIPKLSIYLFGIFLPLVLAELMTQAVRGRLEDEDEDGLPDDWLGVIIRGHLGAHAAVPVAGRGGQLVGNVFLDDEVWNNKIAGPPFTDVLSRGTVAVKDILQGEGTERDTYDAISLLGTLFHLPLAAIASRLQVAHALNSGEMQPLGSVDLVRALLTGVPAKGTVAR